MKSQEFLTEINGYDQQIISQTFNQEGAAQLIRAASRHMIRLGHWRELAELSYMIGDTASSCGVLPMEMLLKPKEPENKEAPKAGKWYFIAPLFWGMLWGCLGYWLAIATLAT